MKLVVISDTHGKHLELPPLPEGDVLIHCGDFMNGGRRAIEADLFHSWFTAQPHPYKIFIAGNHDHLYQKYEQGPDDVEGLIYLQDSEMRIDGIKFWGSPWTPRFMNWAFMDDPGPGMKKHWDQIPPDIDVLITHGPPAGVRDNFYEIGKGEVSVGCKELREAVLRVKPKVHLFGHIHFGYGQEMLGETKCVNAAVLNDQYRLANDPVVVELG